MRFRRCSRLFPAMLVGLVLVASGGCGDGPGASNASMSTTPGGDVDRSFAGYVRTPVTDVSEVVLPDSTGGEVTMVAKADGLRLVFFGYTTCPDVCPATLGYVKMAMASLSDIDRDRLDVDMITVDPIRDDPATLARYVEGFVPTANAIRTDDDALLRSAARAFGASYEVSTDDTGRPEVAHTGDLYAVDDEGRVVLAWPFGSSPADIEDDLVRLLDGERPSPEN